MLTILTVTMATIDKYYVDGLIKEYFGQQDAPQDARCVRSLSFKFYPNFSRYISYSPYVRITCQHLASDPVLVPNFKLLLLYFVLILRLHSFSQKQMEEIMNSLGRARNRRRLN